MTGFTTLDGDDTGSNKIARSATAAALYNNPIAIAQRDSAAPWLNGIGATESITSGSGNWTVPDGVYRIKVTASATGGGGAKAGSSNGGSGGDTTFGSLTCHGGAGGVIGGPVGSGGTSTGGDINTTGESGVSAYLSRARGKLLPGYGYGGVAANPGEYCGGAGGQAVKVFEVSPGDLIAYSIGTAGTATTPAEPGGSGIIIIEY